VGDRGDEAVRNTQDMGAGRGNRSSGTSRPRCGYRTETAAHSQSGATTTLGEIPSSKRAR
jgi:hypothetical protein